MTKKKKEMKNIDPEREISFKSLPPSVRNNLSEEEIEMFLTSEVWSEELFEKLKEFMTSI